MINEEPLEPVADTVRIPLKVVLYYRTDVGHKTILQCVIIKSYMF